MLGSAGQNLVIIRVFVLIPLHSQGQSGIKRDQTRAVSPDIDPLYNAGSGVFIEAIYLEL